MIGERDLAGLRALTYEAGTDPARWGALLDQLGRAIHARSVALLALNVEDPGGTIAASHGFPTDLQRAYDEY